MRNSAVTLLLCVSALTSIMVAGEGPVPQGVPHLDHVFVIVMENHAYGQIVGNPNAPFTNSYLKTANAATNYFAVGHPSLTNYLEIVGGSNFGVRSDNAPDWHNSTCTPNLLTTPPTTNWDNPNSGPVCPIYGTGTDAATPAIDISGNECTAPCSEVDVDGVLGFDAASDVAGKTIADQLADKGLTWKSYQESLPPSGPDNVTYSDGYYTDLTVPNDITGGLLKLYAAKHDPFVYFRSVQDGLKTGWKKNFAGFDGDGGLYENLTSGRVPAFSFIAPNQCNDQHGRENGGSYCDSDFDDNGTQQGLNPALIYVGDVKLRNLIHAIHASPIWHEGRNAIVLVWDENDYSLLPNTNHVLATVETSFGSGGRSSDHFYTHFSLLRSLEGALGLPCLNHACDESTKTMTDLFGGDRQ